MNRQEFIKKVANVQSALKAPKSQYNKFGQYAYRNCEDILEAVKPLLKANDLVLSVTDDIVDVGGRIYVKATATITDGENSISNSSFAREPLEQKGMNEAQITGSASSYSRKYSLNGLLLIDDTKDADATNEHGKGNTVVPPKIAQNLATASAITVPNAGPVGITKPSVVAELQAAKPKTTSFKAAAEAKKQPVVADNSDDLDL